MALKQCKECGGQVSDKAPLCPSCGAKQPKKTGVLTWILVVFVVLFIIGAVFNDDKNSTPQEISPKEQALQNIDFKFDWGKAGFDNVMKVDMTIKNNSTTDIKDFTVECIHSTNSGTVVDRNKRQIYEIIKAGETKEIKDFNMGFIHSQATSSGCGIIDLVVI